MFSTSTLASTTYNAMVSLGVDPGTIGTALGSIVGTTLNFVLWTFVSFWYVYLILALLGIFRKSIFSFLGLHF